MTRTQQAALARLHETGKQWPLSGRGAGDNYSTYCRYSRRTLQALVDQGYAEWLISGGVLPYVVPITDTESSASRQHFIDTGRYLRKGEALS